MPFHAFSRWVAEFYLMAEEREPKRVYTTLTKLSIFALFFSFCLVIALPCEGQEKEPRKTQKTDRELVGTIRVSGAWALYPMAVRWSEEFKKIHPKVRIDISAGGAGKGVARKTV